MTNRERAWGTDGVISLPQPLDPNVKTVDMDGFCFTPQGIRVNMTAVDREEFLRTGYSPPAVGGVERE